VGNPRIRLGLLFRRWWLAVVLATVGGALVAYAFGSRVSTTYEANAKVLIGHPEGLAPTYAELVKSSPVLTYALRRVKPDLSLAELRRNVRGESDQSTRIVTIEADAGKGSEAIALANAVAAGLRDYVSTQPSIGTAGALQSSEPRVEIVDPATSAARIRPRPALLLEFGAFAGLLAGLAFALLAEARTPRINAEEDLAAASGLTVLGTLNAGQRVGAFLPAPPVRAGQLAPYRRLVARLALAADSDFPRTLVVVGADGGHASAKVAVDLGTSLAFDGHRATVADFEGGELARYLQMDGRKRGASLFRRSDPVESAGITFDRFTLRAGSGPTLVLPRSRPGELSVEDADTVVADLSAEADALIVHGPPPTRSRGTLSWAGATAGTFLVVGAGQTKISDLARAVEALEPLGPKLLGAVLLTAAPDPSVQPGEPATRRTDRPRPRSGGPAVRSRVP
jgi:tyrosine-protein kinase